MSTMEHEFSQVRRLGFEPYTLFRVRPITGQYVNVTEAGYRAGGRQTSWPPDPSAPNVFMFGGSTTFGYDVADGESIPSQLGDQLSTLAGREVPVYNFGTPNDLCVQERIRLEQLLVDGHVPAAAVFIDGFDEFIGPYYIPIMTKRYADAIEPRSRWQRLAYAFRELLGIDPTTSVKIEAPDPAKAIDRYIANTRMIRSVCTEFGVKPLFIWQPVPCYAYEGTPASHGSSASALIDCVCDGYAIMSKRRHELGDDFLWLGDIQAGRSEPLYVDADHYTPAFSGEIASHIARRLIDRGLALR